MALPGIGRSTAGAILSIGLDARLPILEGNTIRLFCRLLAFPEDPRRAAGQKLLWRFAEQVLPRRRAGDFNQALMELGSQICRPRSPHCDACPVASLCAARAGGIAERLPASGSKTRYESSFEAAVVVDHQGRVLIRRCQPQERWAGLWDFPRFAVDACRGARLRRELAEKTARLTGLDIEPGARLATIQHAVTRFRITLVCHEATYVGGRLRRGQQLRWVTPGELEETPLSVTGRRLSRLLCEPR